MSVPLFELPADLELIPGKIPEINEQTRAVLARLIMDESIELPSTKRGNQVMYGTLDDAEFIELYRPLVDVLELDPSTDRPPHTEYINRASKLGLTPSVSPIYNRMSLSKVHTGLGFRAKFRFTDWSQKDFIDAGQRLARKVNGRPTREIITRAGRGEFRKLGDFPTVDDIKSRFGRIAVFHELIGYPSCKGWVADDYTDWAFAFYRQNPNRELTARIIDALSRGGRGPSKQPIIKLFGSVSNYKQQSFEEFQYALNEEQYLKESRLKNLEEMAKRDEILSGMITELLVTDCCKDRVLQVAAQYRLAKQLTTALPDAELKYGACLKSPDAFVRWCLAHGEGRLTVANIETHATALGVFDDLWPMYRFQNVNLKLET